MLRRSERTTKGVPPARYGYEETTIPRIRDMGKSKQDPPVISDGKSKQDLLDFLDWEPSNEKDNTPAMLLQQVNADATTNDFPNVNNGINEIKTNKLINTKLIDFNDGCDYNSNASKTTSNRSSKRLKELQFEKLNQEKMLRDKEFELKLERIQFEKEILQKKFELELQSESDYIEEEDEWVKTFDKTSEEDTIYITQKPSMLKKDEVNKWMEDGATALQQPEDNFTKLAELLCKGFKELAKPTIKSPLGKELPQFDGKCDEWPLFFLAYQRMVKIYKYQEEEKLILLQKSVKGAALETIKPLLLSEKNVDTILSTLRDRFGRPEFIMDSLLEKSKKLPAVNENDLNGLQKFSTTVQNMAVTAETLNIEVYNANPYLVKELISKLSYHLRYEWAKFLRNAAITVPTIKNLANWIKQEAETLSIFFQSENMGSGAEKVIKCVYCKGDHNISQCKQFKELDVNRRWSWVSEKKFCFACLRGTHQVRDCRSKKKCSKDNCELYHHHMLHSDKRYSTLLINNQKCPLCEESHRISRCEVFIKKGVAERYEYAKEKRLCFNCLGTHPRNTCISKSVCKTCNSNKHHTLLHAERKEQSTTLICQSSLKENTSMSQVTTEKEAKCLTTSTSNSEEKEALLATAIVNVEEKNVRTVLDGCSESNLVTEKCVKRLKLPVTKIPGSLSGVGKQSLKVYGQTVLTVKSRFNSKKFTIEALVVKVITGKLPSCKIDKSNYKFLNELPLADDNFDIPGDVELLIGVEDYADIMKTDKIKVDKFTAWDSEFGYVVMGKAPVLKMENVISRRSSQSYLVKSEPPLEDIVKKFWETEEMPMETPVSKEDLICEKIYQESTLRLENGRYSVSLPFKEPPEKLGSSFEIAKRRFLSMEKKIENIPGFKENYNKVIKQHLDAGYLQEIDENSRDGYFIPHRAVLRPSSSSTPLRVVFDASCKTDSGKSLNDILYPGPKLQNDIFKILINFRIHPIAVIADLRQMYLQIRVNPDHRKFQRILWRFSSKEPLKIYELNTVTFGVSASPFLALRTIQQLAEDESNLLKATEVVPRDMYVDDLASSQRNVNEAKELYNELVILFKKGGFEIVKWMSNSQEFLNHIPEPMRLFPEVEVDKDVKVLGVKWMPKLDEFSFDVKIENESPPFTKRKILSAAAQIFDPLGLIAPVTLFAKSIIQELWKANVGWDEEPGEDIQKQWGKILEEIPTLSQVRIPRCIGDAPDAKLYMLGFGDASKKGFGAVIYCRKEEGGNVSSILICAKSKVSPMKTETIPRLELNAAVLLSKLMKSVIKSVENRMKFQKIFAFSDATIPLGWICSPESSSWTSFVNSRISTIRGNVDPKYWYHVSGTENPADCLSRGLTPKELLEHKMWFHGPSWIYEVEEKWPISPGSKYAALDIEKKKTVLIARKTEEDPIIALSERCSTWEKLVKTVIFILKFAKKLKKGHKFSIENWQLAEKVIFKAVQKKHFAIDIYAVKKNEGSSHLKKLNPIFEDELLRVGGRLNEADIPFEEKHPVILPKKDRVVDLLINYYHRKNLHTGTSLLLCILRKKFWIISARTRVKQILRKCNRCFRMNPKPTYPLMGNLPKSRVKASRAFENTGVDYAGPFKICWRKGRGQTTWKAYFSLFICMYTKAIHLEAVSDLSTPAFMNALKRFIARRGTPECIHSDNGSNFIGAKNYLEELYRLLMSEHFNEEFQKVLTENQIKWKNNPPESPHFGGIWEANVKSVKSHLYKVVGNQILTFEEFSTVLAEVESVLNSRPIISTNDDPDNPTILTPSHFLMPKPIRVFPSEDVSELNPGRLNRMELLDHIVQNMWKRLKDEYINTLNERSKWHIVSTKITPGTVVLINEDAPPLQWTMGVIDSVFPGKDGVVRVAKVRTIKKNKAHFYVRPIVKLCPLPNQ